MGGQGIAPGYIEVKKEVITLLGPSYLAVIKIRSKNKNI